MIILSCGKVENSVYSYLIVYISLKLPVTKHPAIINPKDHNWKIKHLRSFSWTLMERWALVRYD